MVAAEATPAHHQGKAAFNDPSSGQGAKPFGEELVPIDFLPLRHEQSPLGNREGAHRLHGPTQMNLEPLDKAASVMTIAPHELYAGKLFQERLEHVFGPFLIGAVGSRYLDRQQIALRVNESMSLAPPDFFSPYRSPFQDRERHWF